MLFAHQMMRENERITYIQYKKLEFCMCAILYLGKEQRMPNEIATKAHNMRSLSIE